MTPSEVLPTENALPTGNVVPSVRFTVAIVCLNAQQHIIEALESVAAQSAADFELLVIDGGSTDRTLELVESFWDRIPDRTRVVSEPDDGIYDAMNKALALADGEYIVYLGADDRLMPEALSVVGAVLRTAAPVDIVCGGCRVIGKGGGWTEPAELLVRRGLPRSAPARHQSIFVRTAVLRDAGGFDTNFRIAADYDLYLKLKEAGASEKLVAPVLSEFSLGGTSSRSAIATAREYRDIRIAHGANAFIERLMLYKSVLGVWLFALRHRTVGTPSGGGR
ncbi:MAG: glycosyltransferase family 2 protein [Actinomycetota bacterium]|nr:glycosyltransferase family 2 protein [Actinomycetota bacterium]